MARQYEKNNNHEKIKTLTVEIEEIVEEPQTKIEPALNSDIDIKKDIEMQKPKHSSERDNSSLTKTVVKHRHFKKVLICSVIVFVFIALEIGFLKFKSSVEKAPQNISNMKKEIQQMKDENKKIKEKISKSGSYKIKEENKKSWEKLKEEVEGEE